MNNTPMATALQIVHDVLAARAPAPGMPFRMHAVEPDDVPAYRRALVARFGHMVPVGATVEDAPRVAAAIAPLLRGA